MDCGICGERAAHAGVVYGRQLRRDFELARCHWCGFAFVVDPHLDFERIYDRDYYAGRGADPLVDYVFELEHPDRTIRRYEWEGIATLVSDLVGHASSDEGSVSGGYRWLDYGCGNGGLVRHLRDVCGVDAVGFDEGWIVEEAKQRGVPIVSRDDLAKMSGTFKVVTAIEVLEHTADPVAELRKMRDLLMPGGLLFLTTGNAEPHATRLHRWSYVIPEIHISFFEPRTLELAMRSAGFEPERRDLGRGFDAVLKFKLVKNLRVRKRSMLIDVFPGGLLGRVADRRVRVSEHPIGWAS